MEATFIVINDDLVVNWLNVCRLERTSESVVAMTFNDNEAPVILKGDEADRVLAFFKKLSQTKVQTNAEPCTTPDDVPEERSFPSI